MGTNKDLAPVLEILLAAIAGELNTTQEYLSLEIEQVALKALIEAYRLGDQSAHTRPTIFPKRKVTDPMFPAPQGAFKKIVDDD